MRVRGSSHKDDREDDGPTPKIKAGSRVIPPKCYYSLLSFLFSFSRVIIERRVDPLANARTRTITNPGNKSTRTGQLQHSATHTISLLNCVRFGGGGGENNNNNINNNSGYMRSSVRPHVTRTVYENLFFFISPPRGENESFGIFVFLFSYFYKLFCSSLCDLCLQPSVQQSRSTGNHHHNHSIIHHLCRCCLFSYSSFVKVAGIWKAGKIK